MHKDVQALLLELKQRGYQSQLQGSGHHHLFLDGKKVRKPNGLPVSIPNSPSDYRWREAVVTHLNEAGISLNGAGAKRQVAPMGEAPPDKNARAYTEEEKRASDLRSAAMRKRLRSLITQGAKPYDIAQLGNDRQVEKGAQVFHPTGKNSAAAYAATSMKWFLDGARQSGWKLDVYEAGMNAWEEVNTMAAQQTKTKGGGRVKGSKNVYQARETQALRTRLLGIIARLEQEGMSPEQNHLEARNYIVQRTYQLAEERGETDKLWSATDTGNPYGRGVVILGSLLAGQQTGMFSRIRLAFDLALTKIQGELDGSDDAGQTAAEQEQALIAAVDEHEAETTPQIGVEIVTRERIEVALRTVYALAKGGMEQDEAIDIGMKVASA